MSILTKPDNQETRTIFDLVRAALPADIGEDDFASFVSQELGDKYPGFAAAYALRHCPLLDWDAYLEHNPDVRASGLDPVLHFLNYGLFENRKLHGSHPSTSEATASGGRPKVSVIVSNFNNEIFLGKCLTSLTGQSLRDIEILVVDDASTDSSREIIARFAAKDQRVKLVPLEKNQSLHMTRMAGVPKATGDYIMFVDSDDFYAPEACEKAYATIIKGYEIVAFNIKFVNHSSMEAAAVENWEQWYNSLPPGLYVGEQILRLAYHDEKLPCLMWSKIYRREFLLECFRLMDSGYHNLYEDLYEFLVVVSHAHHIYKIADKLVYYSFGSGITTGGEAENAVKSPIKHSAIFHPITCYCLKHNYPDHIAYVKQFLFKSALKWLPSMDAESAQPYFDELIGQYGPLYSAEWIMRENLAKPDVIADKLRFYIPAGGSGDSRNIGVFLWANPSRQALSLARRLVTALKAEGRVFLFSESGVDLGVGVDGCLKIFPCGDDCQKEGLHLKSLDYFLVKTGIDEMFFPDVAHPFLLWDLLLLKFHGIGASGCYPYKFINAFFSDNSRSLFFKTLKNLDTLWIPDRISRKYFSLHGVKTRLLESGVMAARRDQEISTAAPQPCSAADCALIIRMMTKASFGHART